MLVNVLNPGKLRHLLRPYLQDGCEMKREITCDLKREMKCDHSAATEQAAREIQSRSVARTAFLDPTGLEVG